MFMFLHTLSSTQNVKVNGEVKDIQEMSSSFTVKKMEMNDDFMCNEFKDAQVSIILIDHLNQISCQGSHHYSNG